MMNWKIPVIFAGLGAAVSLLAGIIGGNPFGVILLRLILSALVCGGLGLGVNLIVNKFLPELSAAPPAVQRDSGEEVDIVIDEDIPPAEAVVEQQGLEPEEASEQMVSGDEEEASELTVSVDEEEGPIGATEEVEESEEDVMTFEDADSELDADSEIESAPEDFVPGIAAVQVTDFEDLDTLPDIDTFTPGTEAGEPPSKPSRKDSKVEEVVRDQDPENLARAVRTFMKKDQ
jgi:hypothetical protein